MTQQFDALGKPLAGGQLFLFQAGTVSTPQNAFQDSGLTIALPNPITLDAAGRLPQFFLADGLIKIRLQDKSGVTQLAADNVLVIGPSGGGGGGGTVDPTTIFGTGDLKCTYGTGPISGFVRANGRNIGSAISGAAERANADCQSLFQFLWGVDPNLVVSGGRGISAAADWAANKTIVLPDWRGRALAFLDDMGNAPAGRLTAAYFGAAATVLGAVGGGENITMASANLIAHAHANSLNDPGHNHTSNQFFSQGSPSGVGGGGNFGINVSGAVSTNVTGVTINNASAGSASPTPMRTVQPTMLATIYLKL
jgi:hypothetical protein